MFIGTGVAIITPFNDDKSVDYSALETLIEYQINNNISYIVALGTTGESVTLSNDEKQEVVKFIIEKTNSRVPVVIGIGGNNTQSIIKNIESQDFNGIKGLLSVVPYYNKPTQDGLYEHYKNISKVCPVPIILYNVPSRTGTNMTAQTTLSLANDYKNIAAIKEASGNFEQIMEIIKNKPDGFQVLSGDDSTAFPLITLGGSSVISVIANALPGEYSSLINNVIDGKLEAAREIQYKLLDIMKYLFVDGNPAGVKAALHIKGIIKNNLRLPLVPVSEPTYKRLSELLNTLG